MEEQASQVEERKNRGSSAGRSLDRQRRRAEELLAAQKARLETIETDITGRLDALAQAVATEANPATGFAADELREQAQALSRQTEELHRAKLELADNERRRAVEHHEAAEEVRRKQDELQQQQTQIEAAAAQARQTERDLRLAQEGQGIESEQLAGRQARCAELEKRLAYEQDQLEMLREQTKTQRRRIAQELKAERAAQQRELDRLRHDVELLQAGQRQSFDQAAKQLQRERAELEEKANRERGELRQQQVELEEKEAALQATHRQLEIREQQLAEERSDEANRLRHDIDLLKQELVWAQESAARTVAELAALQQSHESLRNDYEELRHSEEKLQQTHDALRQNHTALEESLAAREQSLNELRDSHDRQQQAYDELRQTLDQTLGAKQRAEQALLTLEQSLNELRVTHDHQQQAYDDLRQSHDQALEAKQRAEQALATLEQSHNELRDTHDRQQQAYDELRQAHEQSLEARQSAEQALVERSATTVVEESQRNELRAEREALIARLADAESNAAKVDLQRIDDLQRRFELAVEDVRSLKRRNSELEEELIGLKSANLRPAASSSPEGASWETTKRRMLESLEADTDRDGDRAEERTTIENTILITDDVVAHKDHEIAELKLLLSQQSSNIGSVAVGEASVAALDQDELVRQEREKLAQLQDEWKTKLRQAEIDISVERAKITRDRAEIEEKLATYQSERAKHVADGGQASEPSDAAKKPTRGRWLARLGLKDAE